MKKKFILIALGFVIYCKPQAAVTYEFSGGRFGDCLISYLHAKWISFVYNIPLLYKPFQYSNQLELHSREERFGSKNFKEKIVLNKQNITSINPDHNCLYIVPYFSEVQSEHELQWNRNWLNFKVNWRNKDFFDLISELIKPIDRSLPRIVLPNNKITVALHIRKGGGVDKPLLSDAQVINYPYAYYSDYYSMLKFPPEFFFLGELKKISEYFDNQPIYAFIFTDDMRPDIIAQRFCEKLQGYPNIEIDYRRENNRHDLNVLEDFFAFTKFDCLIRSQSNFSIVAAKIANYKVEVFPTACHWEGRIPFVDNVERIIGSHFNELKSLN